MCSEPVLSKDFNNKNNLNKSETSDGFELTC